MKQHVIAKVVGLAGREHFDDAGLETVDSPLVDVRVAMWGPARELLMTATIPVTAEEARGIHVNDDVAIAFTAPATPAAPTARRGRLVGGTRGVDRRGAARQ
jgi:hypothetical protein